MGDWSVVGASVRGASHRRSGAPNQDAFLTIPDDGHGPVVAIADGHGSESSFRSDTGARLAVQVAVSSLRAFAARSADLNDKELKRRAESELPRQIVRGWTEMVARDLADHPYDDHEQQALAERAPSGTVPLLPYGSTLLAAAIVGEQIALLQIGDGDIVVVSRIDGSVSRPVPSDPRLIGNETTSLCLPTATDDFRVTVVNTHTEEPGLVMLTTDGYANSFVDDSNFLQAGPDVWELLRQNGASWVAEQLPSWLDEASRQGSGDDITMGLVILHGRGTGEERSGGDVRLSRVRRWQASSRPRSGLLYLGVALSIAAAFMSGSLIGGRSANDLPRSTGSPTSTPSRAPEVEASTQWIWAGGDRLVWQRDNGSARSLRIPALNGRIVTGLDSGLGYIWVALDDRRLLRVDPTDTRHTGEIVLPWVPAGVSVRDGLVLVFAARGGANLEIDPDARDFNL